MDDKPIMTDLDKDDAPNATPTEARKSWFKRFISFFAVSASSQGGARPGNGGGGF